MYGLYIRPDYWSFFCLFKRDFHFEQFFPCCLGFLKKRLKLIGQSINFYLWNWMGEIGSRLTIWIDYLEGNCDGGLLKRSFWWKLWALQGNWWNFVWISWSILKLRSKIYLQANFSTFNPGLNPETQGKRHP